MYRVIKLKSNNDLCESIFENKHDFVARIKIKWNILPDGFAGTIIAVPYESLLKIWI